MIESRFKKSTFLVILCCLILTGCRESEVNNKLEIANSTILDALDTFHNNELYLFKHILIQVTQEEQSERKIEGMVELYLLNNNKTLPYILSLNNSSIITPKDSAKLIELYGKLHEYINLLNSEIKNNKLENHVKEVEELMELTEQSRNKNILSKENMLKNESLLNTLKKYIKNH